MRDCLNVFSEGMERVFLSLGSNVGDRESCMRQMLSGLRAVVGPDLQMSRLMETEPVDVSDPQTWYLNLVVAGVFAGAASELLEATRPIETALGRTGKGTRAPRSADIDILILGNQLVDLPHLRVPHPGILHRRFVLQGLCDIDSEMLVPGYPDPVAQILRASSEQVQRQQIRFQDSASLLVKSPT
jgi:2-amino-4-hydroxy-6-hydroxymethyldihydropteridine diphosphokinase